MRIAIDFDMTIFDKKTGKIMQDAKEVINGWKEDDNEITIFSSRPDYENSTIRGILKASGIKFDRIICGKPSYDILFDDNAERFTSWGDAEQFLKDRIGGIL